MFVFAVAFAAIGTLIIILTHAATNPKADINGDGKVDVLDLSALLSHYGQATTTADLNGDNKVDVLDLSILLSNYGQSVTTPPPSSSTIVGVNGSCYGTTGATEQRQLGSVVRFSTDLSDSCFSNLKSAGVKFLINVTGPYTTSGVSGLDRSSWVSSVTSWYQSHCTPTLCPYFEVLNEPYGTWYWGSNADSQTNADAFADLVKRTYTAFHNLYGSSAPKILAACENVSWTNNWCAHWTGSTAYPNALASTDYVVTHPYGGQGVSLTDAGLGGRDLVQSVHTQTGKPVAITEVGWVTTAPCDSASEQFTEAQQADNITSFMDWARGTGYVPLVTYFTYHDFGSCTYGVVRGDGSHKPGYAALQAEANK